MAFGSSRPWDRKLARAIRERIVSLSIRSVAISGLIVGLCAGGLWIQSFHASVIYGGGTGRVWFRLLSRLGEVELKFSDEPGAMLVMRRSDGSETIFLVDHCHSEGIDPGQTQTGQVRLIDPPRHPQ